ncbi:MAG: DUF4139 domain-containing protein [Pseudomonadota bacterium]
MASSLRNRLAVATLLGASFLAFPDVATGVRAAESTVTLTATERSKMRLTVYPGNLAMITETRNGALASGLQTLRIEDLPATLIDDSILIGSGKDAQLRLVSTRLGAHRIDSQSLLGAFIGQDVKIRRDNDLIDATLLAINHLALVQSEDGVEYVAPHDVVLPALPGDVLAKPAFHATIETAAATDHVSLAYLMGGITWQTAYVGHYNSDAGTLSFGARARITNNSGGDIEDAELRLVAGDPNRVSPAPMMKAARGEMMMSAMADSGAQADRSTLENLHLYGPFAGLDMKDGDVVTLPLLETRDLAATREVIFNGNGNIYYSGRDYSEDFIRPQLRLIVENDGNPDGQSPWPDGVIRIYGDHSTGTTETTTAFLGEDHITLTPAGQKATLTLGQASTITGSRKVVEYDRKPVPNMPDQVKSTMSWTVKNSGPRTETVTIDESLPGGWIITDETHKHEQLEAGQIRWKIELPAGEEATLRWSVSSESN